MCRMANARNSGKQGHTGRDSGGFIALPWSVIDSPAYARLSHPARALLLELARQFVRDNNGRLLASLAYLSKRGWTSTDVITRAKRQLVAEGFIHETVKGRRPNVASWYAVTWLPLDRLHGYDTGVVETFRRSGYRESEPLKVKPTREHLYDRWRDKPRENTSLTPSPGVEAVSIAPSPGVGKALPTPSPGAIAPTFEHPPTPSHGDHLDMPSMGVRLSAFTAGNGAELSTAVGGACDVPTDAVGNSGHAKSRQLHTTH